MIELKALQSALDLNESELGLLFEEARRERLKKGDRIVTAGEVQNTLSFLTRGILRGYVVDENGEEVTDCFIYQSGDVAMGCNGLDEPSLISIEALTPCELLRVPVSAVVDLFSREPGILCAHNKLLREDLKRHWELKRILYQPAMQRYQWFLAAHPGLSERVSSKYVASILGITPVTLSRLKKRLREEAVYGRSL